MLYKLNVFQLKYNNKLFESYFRKLIDDKVFDPDNHDAERPKAIVRLNPFIWLLAAVVIPLDTLSDTRIRDWSYVSRCMRSAPTAPKVIKRVT